MSLPRTQHRRPPAAPKPPCHVCKKTLSSYTGYWCRDCWMDRIRKPTPSTRQGTIRLPQGEIRISRPFYGQPSIRVRYYNETGWDERTAAIVNQMLPPRAEQMVFRAEQRVTIISRIRDIDYMVIVTAMALQDINELSKYGPSHKAIPDDLDQSAYRIRFLEAHSTVA